MERRYGLGLVQTAPEPTDVTAKVVFPILIGHVLYSNLKEIVSGEAPLKFVLIAPPSLQASYLGRVEELCTDATNIRSTGHNISTDEADCAALFRG